MHGRLPGPANRHTMEQALVAYGNTRKAGLASMPTTQGYNLRRRSGYTDRRRK